MGRNGKTVDVNLKTTKIIQKGDGDLSVEEHYLILHVPSRGEVILIRHRKHVTSLRQNLSIVNGYQRYMCDMDSNSSTKSISLYNTWMDTWHFTYTLSSTLLSQQDNAGD